MTASRESAKTLFAYLALLAGGCVLASLGLALLGHPIAAIGALTTGVACIVAMIGILIATA